MVDIAVCQHNKERANSTTFGGCSHRMSYCRQNSNVVCSTTRSNALVGAPMPFFIAAVLIVMGCVCPTSAYNPTLTLVNTDTIGVAAYTRVVSKPFKISMQLDPKVPVDLLDLTIREDVTKLPSGCEYTRSPDNTFVFLKTDEGVFAWKDVTPLEQTIELLCDEAHETGAEMTLVPGCSGECSTTSFQGQTETTITITVVGLKHASVILPDPEQVLPVWVDQRVTVTLDPRKLESPCVGSVSLTSDAACSSFTSSEEGTSLQAYVGDLGKKLASQEIVFTVRSKARGDCPIFLTLSLSDPECTSEYATVKDEPVGSMSFVSTKELNFPSNVDIIPRATRTITVTPIHLPEDGSTLCVAVNPDKTMAEISSSSGQQCLQQGSATIDIILETSSDGTKPLKGNVVIDVLGTAADQYKVTELRITTQVVETGSVMVLPQPDSSVLDSTTARIALGRPLDIVIKLPYVPPNDEVLSVSAVIQGPGVPPCQSDAQVTFDSNSGTTKTMTLLLEDCDMDYEKTNEATVSFEMSNTAAILYNNLNYGPFTVALRQPLEVKLSPPVFTYVDVESLMEVSLPFDPMAHEMVTVTLVSGTTGQIEFLDPALVWDGSDEVSRTTRTKKARFKGLLPGTATLLATIQGSDLYMPPHVAVVSIRAKSEVTFLPGTPERIDLFQGEPRTVRCVLQTAVIPDWFGKVKTLTVQLAVAEEVSAFVVVDPAEGHQIASTDSPMVLETSFVITVNEPAGDSEDNPGVSVAMRLSGSGTEQFLVPEPPRPGQVTSIRFVAKRSRNVLGFNRPPFVFIHPATEPPHCLVLQPEDPLVGSMSVTMSGEMNFIELVPLDSEKLSWEPGQGMKKKLCFRGRNPNAAMKLRFTVEFTHPGEFSGVVVWDDGFTHPTNNNEILIDIRRRYSLALTMVSPYAFINQVGQLVIETHNLPTAGHVELKPVVVGTSWPEGTTQGDYVTFEPETGRYVASDEPGMPPFRMTFSLQATSRPIELSGITLEVTGPAAKEFFVPGNHNEPGNTGQKTSFTVLDHVKAHRTLPRNDKLEMFPEERNNKIFEYRLNPKWPSHFGVHEEATFVPQLYPQCATAERCAEFDPPSFRYNSGSNLNDKMDFKVTGLHPYEGEIILRTQDETQPIFTLPDALQLQINPLQVINISITTDTGLFFIDIGYIFKVKVSGFPDDSTLEIQPFVVAEAPTVVPALNKFRATFPRGGKISEALFLVSGITEPSAVTIGCHVFGGTRVYDGPPLNKTFLVRGPRTVRARWYRKQVVDGQERSVDLLPNATGGFVIYEDEELFVSVELESLSGISDEIIFTLEPSRMVEATTLSWYTLAKTELQQTMSIKVRDLGYAVLHYKMNGESEPYEELPPIAVHSMERVMPKLANAAWFRTTQFVGTDNSQLLAIRLSRALIIGPVNGTVSYEPDSCGLQECDETTDVEFNQTHLEWGIDPDDTTIRIVRITAIKPIEGRIFVRLRGTEEVDDAMKHSIIRVDTYDLLQVAVTLQGDDPRFFITQGSRFITLQMENSRLLTQQAVVELYYSGALSANGKPVVEFVPPNVTFRRNTARNIVELVAHNITTGDGGRVSAIPINSTEVGSNTLGTFRIAILPPMQPRLLDQDGKPLEGNHDIIDGEQPTWQFSAGGRPASHSNITMVATTRLMSVDIRAALRLDRTEFRVDDTSPLTFAVTPTIKAGDRPAQFLMAVTFTNPDCMKKCTGRDKLQCEKQCNLFKEYAPYQTNITVLPKAVFEVKDFPDRVFVAERGATIFYTRPAIPPRSRFLVVAEVSVFCTPTGAVTVEPVQPLRWSDETKLEFLGLRILPVTTGDCTIRISPTDETSLPYYKKIAFTGNLRSVVGPSITALPGPSRVSSLAIHAGAELNFTLVDGTFLPAEQITAVLFVPQPGIEQAVNNSRRYEKLLSEAQIVVHSNVYAMDEPNGFTATAEGVGLMELMSFVVGDTPERVVEVSDVEIIGGGDGTRAVEVFQAVKQNVLSVKLGPNDGFNTFTPETITIRLTERVVVNNTKFQLNNETVNITVVPRRRLLVLGPGATIMTAIATAVTVPLAFAGLSAATAVPRLNIVFSSPDCPNSQWREESSWPTPIESPIPIPVKAPEGEFGDVLGRAIGNCIFCLSCFFFQLLVVFGFRSFWGVDFRTSASHVAFPALSAFPPIFLLMPTMRFCFTVFFYSESPSLIVGAGLVVLFYALMLYFVGKHTVGEYESKYVHLQHVPGRKTPARLWRSGYWFHPTKESYMDRFGHFFKECRRAFFSFVLVEALFVAALGIVAAAQPNNHKGCLIRAGVIAGLFGGFLLLLVLTRPYISPLHNYLRIAMGACEFVATLLVTLNAVYETFSASRSLIIVAFVLTIFILLLIVARGVSEGVLSLFHWFNISAAKNSGIPTLIDESPLAWYEHRKQQRTEEMIKYNDNNAKEVLTNGLEWLEMQMLSDGSEATEVESTGTSEEDVAVAHYTPAQMEALYKRKRQTKSVLGRWRGQGPETMGSTRGASAQQQGQADDAPRRFVVQDTMPLQEARLPRTGAVLQAGDWREEEVAEQQRRLQVSRRPITTATDVRNRGPRIAPSPLRKAALQALPQRSVTRRVVDQDDGSDDEPRGTVTEPMRRPATTAAEELATPSDDTVFYMKRLRQKRKEDVYDFGSPSARRGKAGGGVRMGPAPGGTAHVAPAEGPISASVEADGLMKKTHDETRPTGRATAAMQRAAMVDVKSVQGGRSGHVSGRSPVNPQQQPSTAPPARSDTRSFLSGMDYDYGLL